MPFVLSWSLLEAMATGCPIVASDTPPVREVIRNGETGLVIDFRSPKDLARTIARALDDRAEAERLGAAARREIVQRYTLRELLPRQIRLIQEVAGRIV